MSYATYLCVLGWVENVSQLTSKRINHEPDASNCHPTYAMIRVVAGERKFLAHERSVIKLTAQKHLYQSRRDAWECQL